MHRQNFRPHVPPGAMGPRPGGFRSPPAGFDNVGSGMLPPPPWAISGAPPPSFGPRAGQYGGSPGTPPREFYGNKSGGNRSGGGSGAKGRFYGSPSPGHTPRRPAASPRFTPPYHSQSPGHHQGHQASPRTSTPFGSTRGRERVSHDVEQYYNPSMLQDPWMGKSARFLNK